MERTAHPPVERGVDRLVLGDAGLAGDNDHWAAHVVWAGFAGKPRVAQHKAVYAALDGRMGGALHALQLTTGVPS